MFVIVGKIKSLKEDVEKFEFVIEDDTDEIAVVKWKDDSQCEMANYLVRLNGTISKSNSVLSFNAIKLEAINYQAIINHTLFVLNANLELEVLKLKTCGQNKRDVKMKQQSLANKFTPESRHETMLKAISEFKDEIGVSFHELQRKCHDLDDVAFKDIINDLIANGLIFATIDDKHFLACDL
uniref:Replication protein A C-terminal domain-containing protein n=1 Tax=Tetranychus urticae TaxID=32264 RepID=T1KWF5_TETUR